MDDVLAWLRDNAAAVGAFAAAVQALSAIAIVGLTVLVTRIARHALVVSAEQSRAARAAIGESRRQGLLQAVPLVHVGQPLPMVRGQWEGLSTLVTLSNAGPVVAMGARVLFYWIAGPGDIPTPGPAFMSPEIPVLDEPITLDLDSHGVMNMSPTRGADETARIQRGESGACYSSDWFAVRAMCRGMLGAVVTQDYLWHANARKPAESGAWRLVRVAIRPDPRSDELIAWPAKAPVWDLLT